MTMIGRDFPQLDIAINKESWSWLQENAPVFAEAVADEVKSGAKPQDIKYHVMKRTQRQALAARCEQAAAYLVRNPTAE